MRCSNCGYHVLLSPVSDFFVTYLLPFVKAMMLGAAAGLVFYWVNNLNMGVMK